MARFRGFLSLAVGSRVVTTQACPISSRTAGNRIPVGVSWFGRPDRTVEGQAGPIAQPRLLCHRRHAAPRDVTGHDALLAILADMQRHGTAGAQPALPFDTHARLIRVEDRDLAPRAQPSRHRPRERRGRTPRRPATLSRWRPGYLVIHWPLAASNSRTLTLPVAPVILTASWRPRRSRR